MSERVAFLFEQYKQRGEALTERTQERDQLALRVKKLEEALRWYGEQAQLAKLIHSEGDIGRHRLAKDGGDRARKALEKTE